MSLQKPETHPATPTAKTLRLNSRIWELGQQEREPRSEERFPALAEIVNKLEETELERQQLLRNAAMKPRP